MSGPKINGVNSSFSGVGAFPLPSVQESSSSKSVAGVPNANHSGKVLPSQAEVVKVLEQSAEVPAQPAINRELLSGQIPVLTAIAARGRVMMPQPAAVLNELKALVKNNTIPKETYKQLEKCNKEFTKCFKALGAMKVADIQAMFNTEKSTKCSKLFNAIEQCFGKIDDLLLSLINNPETRSGSIERLQEDYALMYSRLRTAMMSCAEGNLNPKATIASVVAKVAASMSGSAGVLEAVKDELAPILTGLANAEKPGAEMIQVGRVIADAEQALVTLERIKSEGVKMPDGGFIIPMQSDMDALIGTLQDAITNVRQHTSQHLLTGVEQAVNRVLLTGELTDKITEDMWLFFKTEPHIMTALQVISRCPNPFGPGEVEALAKRVAKPIAGQPIQTGVVKVLRNVNNFILDKLPKESLHNATHQLSYVLRTIETRAKENVVKPGDHPQQLQAWNYLGKDAQKEIKNIMEALHSRLFLLDNPEMLEDELQHLDQLTKVYSGRANGEIRKSDYKAMIAGNLDASTVMMTYASGLNHRHIDKETCNAQITKSNILGSGKVNDVQLLTYTGKDSTGKTVTYNRVFKPAMEARLGLHKLNASKLLGYNNTQNAIQTNVGAGYIAEKIGAKNVVSVSRFGVVNGVPGIMMDRAPGMEATYCKHKCVSTFFALSNEMQATLRGNLMRELNRLQWADILSGQVDRHARNYLVDINFDTLKVRVTGIDNDACCGKNMVGMLKLRLAPDAFQRYFTENEQKETQGIEKQESGEPPQVTGYVCDMTKMPVAMRNKLLTEHFGAHTMCLPTVIDAETARHIESINLETYANELREVLQDEECVQAAVSRMKDAQAYIKELAANGKVIDEASWGNADTQKRIIKGQQEQAHKLLGTSTLPKKETLASVRAYEFFWRDFKFMTPKSWIV